MATAVRRYGYVFIWWLVADISRVRSGDVKTTDRQWRPLRHCFNFELNRWGDHRSSVFDFLKLMILPFSLRKVDSPKVKTEGVKNPSRLGEGLDY